MIDADDQWLISTYPEQEPKGCSHFLATFSVASHAQQSRPLWLCWGNKPAGICILHPVARSSEAPELLKYLCDDAE